MPTAPKPYFRLDSMERTQLARPLVGRPVVVEVDVWRDGRDVTRLVGVLLAAARFHGGTINDVLVLRYPGGQQVAFSGATVRSIRELTR
jgi:hypothetical protein